MQEYIKMVKNTFNYKGRARRREYWVPTLINVAITYIFCGIIGCFVFVALGKTANQGGSVDSIFSSPVMVVCIVLSGIFVLYSIFVLLSNISLTVRRYHDVGRPGWVLPLCIVGSLLCGIGSIVNLVFCCLDSTEDNEWGENPKKNNEYPSNTSIIVSVVAVVVSIIFVMGCLIGGTAFTSVKLSNISTMAQANDISVPSESEDLDMESGEDSDEDALYSDDMEEDMSDSEIPSEETDEDENADTNTDTSSTDGSYTISVGDTYSVSIKVPDGYEVLYNSDTMLEFEKSQNGKTLNVNYSSTFCSTKEEAIEELNSEFSDKEEIIPEESQCAVESQVAGHPVYYNKVVNNFLDTKYIEYKFFVDVGAEYMLECRLYTDLSISDEEALVMVQFQ